MASTISVSTELARSPSAMQRGLPELAAADPPVALPILARYSRSAPGWIRTIVAALLRIALAFVLGRLFMRAAGVFLLGIVNNLDSLVAAGSDIPTWFWLTPTLLGALLTLAFSQPIRQYLREPWNYADAAPPFPLLRTLLRPVDWAGRALTILGAFVLLAFTWMPIGFALARLVAQLIAVASAAQPLPFFVAAAADWQNGMATTLVCALPAALAVLQRRRQPLTLALLLLWAVGLFQLYRYYEVRWVIWQPGWLLPELPPRLLTTPWWDGRAALNRAMAFLYDVVTYPNFALYVALLLSILYPIRLGLPLARILGWPAALVQRAVIRVVEVFAVRQDVHRAVRAQIRRNRQRLAGRPYWTALDDAGFRRFVTSTERLSYFRWITYAHAPGAQVDTPRFAGVACRAVHFDNAMSEPTVQVGATLRLNGLQINDNATYRAEWQFDALSIGSVDDHDVELFVTQCADPKKLLREISAHVLPGHTIGANLEGILRDNCAAVFMGSEPGREGCAPAHAQKLHSAAQRTRRRQIAGHVRRPISYALLVIALVWQGPAAGRYLAPRLIEWFEAHTPASGAPGSGAPGSGVAPDLGRTTAVRQADGQSPHGTGTSAPTPEQSAPVGSDGMPLLTVSAGSFTMGNPDGKAADRTADEAPAHEVTLDAFHIDAYEVGQAQYGRCVEAGVCRATRSRLPAAADHPVVGVRWSDADAYCRWVGRRLPTEAEWEKAARWDPATGAVRLYPWGNRAPSADRLNFDGKSGGLQPVGASADGRSAVGAYQMAGNVWEWTADWYAPFYYGNSALRNPGGPSSGTLRVARGGGWDSTAFQVRSSNRFELSPTTTADNLGFRCAQNAD